MVSQQRLAAQMAVRQGLAEQALALGSVSHSERTAHTTAMKQCLKAGAELAKGNLPQGIYVDDTLYYLVESRSTLVGTVVDVDIMDEAYAFTAEGEAVPLKQVMQLKVAVTGGDVHVVNMSTRSCSCEKGKSGDCWHYFEADFWQSAGQILASTAKLDLEGGQAKDSVTPSEVQLFEAVPYTPW